jgi:hypothetical protein
MNHLFEFVQRRVGRPDGRRRENRPRVRFEFFSFIFHVFALCFIICFRCAGRRAVPRQADGVWSRCQLCHQNQGTAFSPRALPCFEYIKLMNFLRKQDRFAHRVEVYEEFLDILHTYQENRSIEQVYSRVQVSHSRVSLC